MRDSLGDWIEKQVAGDGVFIANNWETSSSLIFELSKQVKTVRHYVWSNLDYSFKVSGIAIGCATYTEHTEVERGIQACL